MLLVYICSTTYEKNHPRLSIHITYECLTMNWSINWLSIIQILIINESFVMIFIRFIEYKYSKYNITIKGKNRTQLWAAKQC